MKQFTLTGEWIIEAENENEMWEILQDDLSGGYGIKNIEIDEVKELDDDNTYCHLCGAVEKDHYCTNKSCYEYTRYEVK